MSHKLRHEYFRIEADVIWEVLTVHLGPLHVTVKRMIADLDQVGLPRWHTPTNNHVPAGSWSLIGR